MHISRELIDVAIEFKQLGLAWEPEVGHYVYDANGEVKPSSPFQPGVYFLLNYDCFMDRVGGVERFKEIMTWLPTWEQAREILRSLGVSDAEQQREVSIQNALAERTELHVLYHMIQRTLASQCAAR